MRASSNIPNLPPSVEAHLRSEGSADLDALGEVWMLCESARPDLAPDPARKQSARRALLTAVTAPEPRISPIAGIAGRLRRLVRSRTFTPRRSLTAALVTAVVLLGVFLTLRPTTYHAPAGQTLSVHLPDGSTVTLNSASTLRVSGLFSWAERRVRLDGEGFFEVAHENKPFIVETFDAETRVLGTKFNVFARPTESAPATWVTVAEGKVGVRTRQGDGVVLTPGLAAHTLPTGAVSPPDSVSLTHALAWREGGLAFRDQPLGAIFDEIERRFAIEIVADDELRARPQSYFKHGPFDAETILSELTQMSGARYRPIASGYEVYLP